MAKVFKGEGDEARTFIRDAQGNVIYPCGYTGGAKERIAALCSFEERDVSLSSNQGIAQIEKDKEYQLENPDKCMHLGNILSDEAMDHVKRMCGPGYTIDPAAAGGKPVPIEPESEGSNISKGPGFFIQPHALTPGTGVEGFFGSDAKLCEDDLAYICKNVEDDQGEIKSACINYFMQFFKAMDEDGKGVLVGDAFKTVIGKLEEDMPMEAKEAPWMTPLAAKLIADAGEGGTIDYYKFLETEMGSPRDDAL